MAVLLLGCAADKPLRQEPSAQAAQTAGDSSGPKSSNKGGAPAAKPAEESASEQIARYTRLLAYYTGALMVFTAVLALVSIWQGKIAQKSIRLARDEFVAAHRPKLRVRQFQWSLDDPEKQGAAGNFHIRYTVANVGDADASHVVIEAAFWIEVLPGLDTPTPKRDAPATRSIALLKAGASAPVEYSAPGLWGRVTIARTRGIWKVLFRGRVAYTDERGTRRETGFDRIFSAQNDLFIAVEGSEYAFED